MNNPANATKMVVGDSLVFTTSSIIEIKAFSFDTNATVEIELTMGRISGSITPRIEFYNPEGGQVYSGSSSSLLKSGKLKLSDAGKFTILGMDQNVDGAGTFCLKIE